MADLHLSRRQRSSAPPRRALLVAAAALAACAGVLAGCAADEDGEFTISEIEQYEECLSAASPIRPEMFAARDRVDSIGVFMQTDFRLPSVSDAVYFEIYQPKLVRTRLGEPFELSDPFELVRDDFEFDEPPVMRGQLLVADTCPDLDVTFAIRGTVVFEELGAQDGNIVRGELIDGEIVNVRDETIVARHIEGSWSFTVDGRSPYQAFPSYREKIPRGPVP